VRTDVGSDLDRALKGDEHGTQRKQFLQIHLVADLGMPLLAINFVVGPYSAGGKDGDDFLKGVLFGATIAFWLVCLYSWGVVTSSVKARSKSPTW